ncbi:unnamed protein product [Heligmosomoides polygyrus]|uniref:Short coiled-coil protein n=1 Tax=Heligmosomoides polygyrus TaxID=6339 RepID=A0A183FLT6_HELPZ|nr:unnamed protein product [Heligmosomoides polygyrus]
MQDLPSANSQDIPLVDDDDVISVVGGSGTPRPAQPLPREEPSKEEKARLISQVLELQNTLVDLSRRVDSVKEECLKLHSENIYYLGS